MVTPSGSLTETAQRDADIFNGSYQTAFDAWEAGLPERAPSAWREWIDVTPLSREIGLLPPTALSGALWADIQAIPAGFEMETLQSRLTDVLRHAFFAVVAERGAETAEVVQEELLVFPVLMPTLGQEISDYPVALLFRPGQTHKPTFILMTPEEAAGIRLARASVSTE